MDYVKIGVILKAHGVKGAVKVLPLTDDINRYKKLKSACLSHKGGNEAVEVQSAAIGAGYVNLKLKGVDTRTEAEALKGRYILVARKDAITLPEGSYFIFDLEGCRVADDKGFQYGELKEVVSTGANDVYIVQGQREWLIPALKKLILSVDIEAKLITISADVAREVIPDAD